MGEYEQDCGSSFKPTCPDVCELEAETARLKSRLVEVCGWVDVMWEALRLYRGEFEPWKSYKEKAAAMRAEIEKGGE